MSIAERIDQIMMIVNNISVPVGLGDQITRPLVGVVSELGKIRAELTEKEKEEPEAAEQ